MRQRHCRNEPANRPPSTDPWSCQAGGEHPPPLSSKESRRYIFRYGKLGVSRNSPAEDLALVAQAQDHLEPPRALSITYDVLFSIACGVLVGGQALPGTIRPYVTIVVMLSLVALITWWRRRLGWWLSGYTPRRARWVAFAMLVPLLGLMLWAWMAPEPGWLSPPLSRRPLLRSPPAACGLGFGDTSVPKCGTPREWPRRADSSPNAASAVRDARRR